MAIEPKPTTKKVATEIFGWDFDRVKEYEKHGESQLALFIFKQKFLDLLYWKDNKVWGYLTSKIIQYE